MIALRAEVGGVGRQGDDRLHEPPHLRRTLYRELVRLRPEWDDADDGKGAVKIVMTGSASDPPEWQRHIQEQSPAVRRWRSASAIPTDPLKVVLVRDMLAYGIRRSQPAHHVR